MPLCKGCDHPITRRSPSLICIGCNNSFHANGSCSDISKSQLSVMKSMPGTGWTCGTCRMEAHSGVRSPPDTRHSPSFPSGRSLELPGAGGDDADPFVDDRDIGDASQPLTAAIIKSLVGEVKSLRSAVIFCSDKISDFESKLVKFTEVVSKVNKLEKENEILKKQMSELDARINNIEQFSRSNNVEIQNVPEKSSENLYQVLDRIGSFINMPIEKSMIDHITRVPTRETNRAKNIVVRFVSKTTKDNFISSFRKRRIDSGEVAAGLSIPNVSDRVYVNDHLTLHNKILYKQTRSIAKEKGYKFAWVQNGKVLVRKDDNSRILQVASDADLQRL